LENSHALDGFIRRVLDKPAMRLTILEGLSLRAAAVHLQISPMVVRRAQKKALATLRQQLVGAG
jgi:DNA-directed RNA polymerase specialized sigma subunit